MFELAAALFVIFIAVGAVVMVATLIGFLFKLLFLPFVLIGGLVKFVVVSVLCVIGMVLAVVLGPVLLVIGAVFLVPVLIVGGLAWAGLHVLAAV